MTMNTGPSWDDERRRQRQKELKRQRRAENVGIVATLSGAGLLILFWLAAALLPLALMGAAIYYLLTH